MKIIKYLLFLILIFVIAGSIYVATKDGDFEVQSSKVVNAPATLLYEEVLELSNWQNWEAWSSIEGMELETGAKSSGEGAKLSWTANELRDGSITTVAAIPYQSITQEIILETSVGRAEAMLTWKFEPSDGGTLLSWSLKGSQDFKEKLAFTLQDQDLREIFQPILDSSMSNLETSVIAQMEEYSININGITRHGGGYYMYQTTAAKYSEVNSKASEMIGEIMNYMEEHQISQSGKPFVVYNQRDERSGTTIFSAAVPTPNQVVTPAGSPVLNGYLEPQKVVKATLKGNRKNAPEAWEKAYRFIEKNELEINPQGQPFEIFITNPAEQDNPALWITEIYIPIV